MRRHKRTFNNFFKKKYQDGNLDNFGDLLGPIIVRKVLEYKNKSRYNSGNNFFTIGSIMHFAESNDNIWGTGVNGKVDSEEYTFKNLNVYSVRGPLSREFLVGHGIYCPPLYGDPALLFRRFFPEFYENDIVRDVLVISNYNEPTINNSFKYFKVISPLGDPFKIINEITKSNLVISSSLHAIILAEVYGRNAILLKTQKEHKFKYVDYLLGTGRDTYSPAKNIKEALKAKPLPNAKFNPEAIIDSFPVDLYI
jgi:pyruvyltransferase